LSFSCPYFDLVVKLSLQSRDESCIADDWIHWDDHPQAIEEIQAMLQRAKEAALKRENALAHAFSHQVLLSFVSLSHFPQSFLLH
jgi:accessory colonization factor AcfC